MSLGNPESFLRSTLEALRATFLGAASRHASVESRWVIAGDGFRSFLSGPEDSNWKHERLAGLRSFTVRHPHVIQIPKAEQKQFQAEQPEARLVASDDSTARYLIRGVESTFQFRGDIPARDAFNWLSRDAGHCLFQLLQFGKVAIKLPALVPYGMLGTVHAVSGSTNLPPDLAGRWLAFMHAVGWQNLPFSPLRAEREIWYGNTSIVGDPAELQNMLGTPVFEDLRGKIPFPPQYFASTIRSDLNLASVYAIDALLSGMLDLPTINVAHFENSLAAIPPGNADANRFHSLVTEMLTIIFDPDLNTPQSEVRFHEGRGRIDIVFSNVAERGYFADLPFRHNIKCPVVFFECKNYSDDVAGPEFSQLVSRFSEARGNVGFLVCRKVDDWDVIQKRCRDRFQDKREHILVLSDADLIAMLRLKSEGDVEGISRYLHERFRPIFLDMH